MAMLMTHMKMMMQMIDEVTTILIQWWHDCDYTKVQKWNGWSWNSEHLCVNSLSRIPIKCIGQGLQQLNPTPVQVDNYKCWALGSLRQPTHSQYHRLYIYANIAESNNTKVQQLSYIVTIYKEFMWKIFTYISTQQHKTAPIRFKHTWWSLKCRVWHQSHLSVDLVWNNTKLTEEI